MSWKSAKTEITRRDPMQEFATLIVEKLEQGVKPWVRPFDPVRCPGPQTPINAVTKQPYHGGNNLMLCIHPLAIQTGDPRFVTYKQAEAAGWQVQKGARSVPAFFYKQTEIEDEKAADGTRVVPVVKSFALFHASQVERIPKYTPPTIEEAPWQRPDAADIILKNSGAVIREQIVLGGDSAFYSPKLDFISIPPDRAFDLPAEWAATALHELSHWTGHPTRLNRDLTKRYGSAGYALEELRAELSSAFIAQQLSIPSDIPNHTSYIRSWLKPLKDDKREIFRAASDAQKIADMVLGFHPEFAAKRLADAEPERPQGGPSASHQPRPSA